MYYFHLQGVGFISDDSYNSQIAGKNLYEGLSFWQDLFKEIKAWLIGNGRLSPFACLLYKRTLLITAKSLYRQEYYIGHNCVKCFILFKNNSTLLQRTQDCHIFAALWSLYFFSLECGTILLLDLLL